MFIEYVPKIKLIVPIIVMRYMSCFQDTHLSLEYFFIVKSKIWTISNI